VNSNKASTSNILKFFKPNNPSRISARSVAGKRAVFLVLLAVLFLGFSFVFITNFSHAQATPAPATSTTTPKPQAMTQAQIEKIEGWNDWTLGKEPPPGTKVMTITDGADTGKPATYMLIPSDQWTIEHNVVVPAAQKVGAAGSYIGNILSQAAIDVVITVLSVIAGFCKLLLMFAGWVLDATLNPNLYNFTNNTMIVKGWTMVRDVCNLFFLLVLLFIALCTILKIEKYHAKKTLLTLIIMALLINFSKPIAIFIFDGSQLLMNMFLSQMGKDPSTKFVTDLSVLIYDNLMTTLKAQGSSWEIAIQYLFVVVFVFMFAVAMFVTALMLIIRIVAIMILIIVSPLAFFAAIIPDFSKMSSSWWSALFEYSYYGPAAAFFLLLGTQFALGNVLPKLNSPNQSPIIMTLIQYFTTLVFLYASIFMAKKMGGGAGAAIVGNANKFMKWGAGMTKTGGVWGAMGRTTGVTGGVSQRLQQSGLTRWMTKEGRKRNQKAMEARVAGVLGVTGARTKRLKEAADDLKNESNANIQRMAEGGDMVAAYVASNRGILNDNIVNAIQPRLARDADMRNEFVRNARKNGQAHQALNIRLQTAGLEDAAARQNNPTAIAEHEIARTRAEDLVKDQNIHDLAQIPEALTALNALFDNINARATNAGGAFSPAQVQAAQQLINNIVTNSTAQNYRQLTDPRNVPGAPAGAPQRAIMQ